MAKRHPVETKARAFCLYLDYVPVKEIAKILNIPAATVTDWIPTGVNFDSAGPSWKDIRKLTEAYRGLASSKRELGRMQKFEWDDYVTDYRDEAAQALQTARQYIVDAMVANETDDKGSPIVTPSVSSLKGIIETEQLIQGRATKITEVQHSVTILVGQVIRHVLDVTIEDKQLKEVLMDRFEDGFTRITAGASEKELEKALK